MSDPFITINHLLKQQVENRPDDTALQGVDFSYSFRQFSDAADRLACQMMQSGVEPGSRVGICLDLSFDMVLGIFAILRSGGCYVPTDPMFPDVRITNLYRDAAVTHVVCTPDLVDRVASLGFIPVSTQNPQACRGIDKLPAVAASDTAYVLFTSGSTGTPKGVEIAHSSVVNLLCYIQDRYPINNSHRVLLKSPYTFDGSVWELFGWLIPGATLFVAPPNAAKDPARLANLVERYSLSFAFFVPSMLQAFLDYVKAGNHHHKLRSLRWVSVGGEVLPVPLVSLFYELIDGSLTKLFNVYGPTETTVYATTFLCQPDVSYEKIPIGEAVTNDFIYILDDQLLPVDEGQEGEIFIGGAGVGKGYLNRPDLNAERFLPDPFAGHGLMYRTGDLGRQIGPDLYDFIGRRDFQVKLRGLRIEMGEVEHALLKIPGIRACAVVFSKDRKGSDCLVAYLVMNQPVSKELWELAPELLKQQIVDHLSREIPAYMIPSEMVVALDFPLSHHGKVDRKKLPAVAELSTTATVENTFQPTNDLSFRLYNIWREVLGRDAIGVSEDFFAAGGHSLKALQVITAVMRDFGVELPVGSFYEEMTLPAMEALVRQLMSQPLAVIDPALADPSITSWPLNAAMQELWFVNSIDQSGITRNILIEFLIDGNPDPERLRDAIRAVVDAEPMFRSVFPLQEAQPMQLILDEAVFDFDFVDLSPYNSHEADKRYATISGTIGQKRFDLEKLPLLAFQLVKLQQNQFRLLLCIHHLVFDGWSLEVFVRRLVKAYECSGCQAPEPPSAGFYAKWALVNFNHDVQKKELDYWKQKLHGIPELLTLPVKANADRRAVRSAGDRFWWRLSPQLTSEIHQAAATLGVTPFALLTTGFQLVLAAHASQRDVVVGTPFANRSHPLIADAIGLFTNMVSLRLQVGPADNLVSLIQQTNKTAGEAFSNASVIFSEVVKAVLPRIQRGINPVFQASVVMQNWPATMQKTDSFSICQREIGNFTHKLDLMLNIEELNGAFVCWIEFDTSLFDRSFIERLSIDLTSVYQSVISDPGRNANEWIHSVETPAKVLIDSVNQTAVLLPENTSVVQLIEQVGAVHPQRCAVEFDGMQLTYSELVEQVSKLAVGLVAFGVKPGDRVGVCLPRSIDLVVSLLAVMKAGGAYVPVDPHFPVDRIQLIVHEAAPSVVITTLPYSNQFGFSAEAVFLIDRESASQQPAAIRVPVVSSESAAYILFTSGSTGKPKGIVISHRSLINFLLSMQRQPGITEKDVVLALTTVSFDISGLELWLPLISGAKLVMAHADSASDPYKIATAINNSGVTLVQATPATWQMLADIGWEGHGGLKILCGGEALKTSLAGFLLPRCKELWNMYGPTETTIWSLIHKVSIADLTAGTSIPIGRPVANTVVYILNEFFQQVSPGYPGELYIGGEGLAKEYFQQPSLTHLSFVNLCFQKDRPLRLYKTGDQVRMSPDGDIFFLERTDNQIKIRGFRIEPGDIENVLQQVQSVDEAVVIAQNLSDGRKILVAFVKVSEDDWPGDEFLRLFVRERLPDYMVPALYSRVDQFPKTPNGKIDRKALALNVSDYHSELDYSEDELTDDEKQLIALWKDVLHRDRLSVDENFFDAGGDSLVAVRLIVKVEKEFGKRLPLASLFQSGTVRSMARLLENPDHAKGNWRSLVAIRPGGSRKPLFLVHAAGLNLLLYNTVVNKLHPDQPVYGLQARGLDGSEEPLYTLPEIATHYINEIESVDPDGPYALAGFCMGGTIAWEMACQLTSKGKEVAFIGLFETIAYRVPEIKPNRLVEKISQLQLVSNQIIWNIIKLSKTPISQQKLFLKGKLNRIKRRLHGTPEIAMQEAKTEVVDGILHVVNSKVRYANEIALASYILKPNNLKVHLFKASEQTFFIEEPVNYGWSSVALGGVELVLVDGTHNLIFAPPHDELFASKLQRCLDLGFSSIQREPDGFTAECFVDPSGLYPLRVLIPEKPTMLSRWWLRRLFPEGVAAILSTESTGVSSYHLALCSPFNQRLGQITQSASFRWFVPQWVELGLPLSGVNFEEKYAPFRKTRNAIRQAGYAVQWYGNDDEKLGLFYERMYVPYISSRQKEDAILSGIDEFRQILADGGSLLLVGAGIVPVAGAIIDRQHTPLVHSIGVDPVAGTPFLKLEVIRTLFYYAALQMQKEGYALLNLGGCRPFVSDSSLWFKKSLGAHIIPPLVFSGQGLYLAAKQINTEFANWWHNNALVALDGKQQPVVVGYMDSCWGSDPKDWYDYASKLLLPGINRVHLYTLEASYPDVSESWLSVHQLLN
ncbi:MAG: amino acid adenylation domain-containing protein [Bacteroidales bacterium]|nr:amino acid adenylation domain-containing protein [Bacteroidales bacterium]